MPLSRQILCGLLLFVLALGACRKKEEGPEEPGGAGAPAAVETEAVAGDLPAGAGVVVSAYDLESFWTRLKSTQLYIQLTAIPEVKALLDPKQNPRLAQSLEQFQSATGLPLNEETLFKTLGKKIQVGVYPQGTDEAATRVVLLADMGDKDALASILTNLKAAGEGKGRTFKDETYKDVKVTVVSDSAGVSALYGFHKEKLVAANDQASFESAVDALDGGKGTMQSDSLYRRALPQVGDAAMTVFVRREATRALVGQARRAAGDTTRAGQSDRFLEVADRYNVQSAFIAGWGWTEQGLAIRSYSLLDPTSTGAAPLREMLKTPPSKIEVTSYYPDSTLGVYALNLLDAPRIYDFAVAYLRDIAAAQDTGGTSSAAQVDSAIAAFERETGMSLREDVLGWMGREAALGLNGVVKGGFFPIPELGLTIQAADTTRARAFFTKLEAQLTAAVQSSPQAGFPLQFQEEDYKGVKVRFAPTPMGEGLAPGWALQDGYAVVALSGKTLKRMIDARTGAVQPVRSNPSFQALGDFFPAEANAVGFLDVARFLGEIGSAISSFQEMRGGGSPPGEPDTMSRVITALQNVQAAGLVGVNDGSGVAQRILVKVQ